MEFITLTINAQNKRCKKCGISIIDNTSNQIRKYCGSGLQKTGCAYQKKLETARARYTPKKRRGSHLSKVGKRRCYVCQGIYPLSDKFFYKSKYNAKGYTYNCRPCQATLSREFRKRKGSKYLGAVGVRFKVFQRDNFTCQYCGRGPQETILHIDHIVPKSKGGKNDFDNLITACQACNVGKGDVLLEEIAKIANLDK